LRRKKPWLDHPFLTHQKITVLNASNDLLNARQPLLFVRHGATQPNLDGLRCGGDVDVPMTHIGQEQILKTAQHLLQSGARVDLIISSGLLRAQQSAAIISRVMGDLPIVILPSFNERLLGQWNLQPAINHEVALRSGATPPGGESNHSFTARVRDALMHLSEALDGAYGHPWAHHSTTRLSQSRAPLMVGSKGVSRVMHELLGLRPSPLNSAAHHASQGASNAAVLCFDLATIAPSPAPKRTAASLATLQPSIEPAHPVAQRVTS
jgi:2,3-bisphosphoglycerate-dependent phosphoglycerate mutase